MDLTNVSNQRRWGIVGLLFTASLINYLDRAAISFALPLISRDFHLTPETKGLLLSSFFWSYALMQVPIGWCADRFNLRWLYAGAFALWSLAQGLTGLAESLAVLIGFRILLGVGESIYLPGGTKIVSVLFPPKERGLPSGLFDFGTRTGLVLEGILVPWLLVRYGWRHTFLLLGFAGLLWIVPWFLVFPRRMRAAERAAISSPPAVRARMRWSALLNRNLLGICLGFFCFDYYWYVLVTWLPDYLVTVRHLSIVQAGFYASLVFFTFGVSEPIGGWIADILIRRGWNETRTRKGIVTVAFFMGLLLIAAMRTVDYADGDRLLDRGLAGRTCHRQSAGDSAVLRSIRKSRNMDRSGKFCRQSRRNRRAAGGGISDQANGSYVPGFELGAIVLLTGLAGLLVHCRRVEAAAGVSRH